MTFISHHFPETILDDIHKSSDSGVILNIGRLDPQKDQKTLIKAFALLADKYPKWKLRIIGNGVLKPELELLATVGQRDLDPAVQGGGIPRSSSATLIRSIAASISRRSPVRRARSNISRTSIRARSSGETGAGGEAVIR